MSFWFTISCLGFLVAIPLNFISVEHQKLEKKYGYKKGKKIGEYLGYLSGWGLFGSWIGIWITPQPRMFFPFSSTPFIWIPLLNFLITLEHLVIGIPLLIIGMWLGIRGVQDLGLKVAETHRPEDLIVSGIYRQIRHPQYLGGIFAHLGITVLLAAVYSLFLSPIVITGILLISWKEDIELEKEFSDQFIAYRKSVPMFFPWKKNRTF